MTKPFNRPFRPRFSTSRSTRPHLEALETREVPAKLMFLDFDGATLAEVQDAFRRVPGWQTPDRAYLQDRRSFVGEVAALQTNYGGYTRYRWLDMNSDGVLNRTDGDLVVQRILGRLVEDYLGYDIDILREDNTNHALNQMNNGRNGDFFIFVWGTHDPNVDGGLGGQAPLDIGNTRDDIGGAAGSVAGARWIANQGLTGTAALDGFVNIIANFIAHEAGHSFGLGHINTDIHPEAWNIDMQTRTVGTANLRFRDITFRDDFPQIGSQNARQTLFNNLGVRDPVQLFPDGTLRVIGNATRTTVNDVITINLNPSNPTVTVNGVSRLVAQSAVRRIVIEAGDGGDTINLEHTNGKPVVLWAGEENDVINLSPGARNLLNVNSNITVNALGQFDTVNLFDDNNAAATTYSITDGVVQIAGRPVFAVVAWDTESLALHAGSSPSATVNVTRTSIPTRVARAAVVNVGGTLSGLEGIRARLSIDNQPRRTALTVDDRGSGRSRPNVLVDDTLISNFAPANISYVENDLSSLTLLASNAGNTFTLFDTPQNALRTLVTTIEGGTGVDTMNIRGNTGALVVEGKGNLDNVNIGNNGSLSLILNTVSVSNRPAQSFTGLSVDASAFTGSYTATLTASSLSFGGPAINFLPADLRSLTIRGGRGASTYNVLNTPQSGSPGGVTTTLSGGVAADTVNIRATTGVINYLGGGGGDAVNLGDNGSLAGIQGSMTLSNAGGSRTLVNVRDQNRGGGRTLTLDNFVSDAEYARLTGLTPATIYTRCSDTATLQIFTGTGAITTNMLSTCPGMGTNISGNGTDNVVNIGNNGSLANVRGGITISNTTGNRTAVTVDDRNRGGTFPGVTLDNQTTDAEYVRLTGLAPATIYSRCRDTHDFTVRTGIGAVTTTVVSTCAIQGRLTVQGNSADTALAAYDNSLFTLTATNAGRLTGAGLVGPVNFTGVGNLVGGAGNDVFAFAEGASVSGYLDGGAGVNTVDYSAWTTGTYVDLANFIASGTGFIVNFKNAFGGAGDDYLHGDWQDNWLVGNDGHDILVGGAEADYLQGGAGRDMIFGGEGADWLEGGLGEDLLIDGTTNYDDDVVALSEIWNEWVLGGGNFDTRVENLRNGTGLSTYRLDAANVFSDGEADTMLGEADRDWFWALEGVDFTDLEDGETLN